jgi:hypothetical protein
MKGSLPPCASRFQTPTASAAPRPPNQVWKNGEKVDEFVGAAKDKLIAFCQKYA